jgi:hypothetical protein
VAPFFGRMHTQLFVSSWNFQKHAFVMNIPFASLHCWILSSWSLQPVSAERLPTVFDPHYTQGSNFVLLQCNTIVQEIAHYR